MSLYTDVFTGLPVQPSNLSYETLTLTTAITQLSWPLVYQESPNPVANLIAVISNTAGFSVQMPDATLVSVGQATIFVNIGTNNFNVNNFSGGSIASPLTPLTSGLAYYIMLTDNTTQNGTWLVIPFGNVGSSTTASALAGYGLVALPTATSGGTNLLNTIMAPVSINTPYTVDPVADRAKFFIWRGGTADFTLADATVAPAGFYVSVNNESTSAGTLNVIAPGGQTIDGLGLFTLNVGESATFVCNGSNWNTLGYGNNATISIGVNNYPVLNGNYTLTTSQSSREIQNITGTLTGNVTIFAYSVPQTYYVTNSTTGNFTVSFQKTSGINVNIVPQGTTMQLYCDGTDMYFTPTNTVGVAHFNNGTAANPSISFLNDGLTGVYYSAANSMGISVNTTPVALFDKTVAGSYVDAQSGVLIRQSAISIYVLDQCYN